MVTTRVLPQFCSTRMYRTCLWPALPLVHKYALHLCERLGSGEYSQPKPRPGALPGVKTLLREHGEGSST